MAKIARLTADQERDLVAWRQQWLVHGCSTEPADRPRAEAAITAMYGRIGEPPPVFYWVSSPASACLWIAVLKSFSKIDKTALRGQLWNQLRGQLGDQLGGQLWDQLWDQLGDQLGGQLWDQLGDQLMGQLWDQLRGQLWDQLWDQLGGQLRGQLRDQLWGQLGGQLRDQLWDQLWDQLGGQLRGQLRDQLWGQLGGQLRDQLRDQLRGQLGDQLRGQLLSECFYGQIESYWTAYYEFAARIGVVYAEQNKRDLALWSDLAQSCGWWWPYRGTCVVSDRPEIVRWETAAIPSRLHSADGPAVRYRDGYSLYAWRGSRVPREWIESRESLTPEIALSQSNIELRRLACEVLGWDKILASLPHRVIDHDADPLVGDLISVDLPGAPDQRYVKARCGTGRDVFYQAPRDAKRAIDVAAASYQVTPQKYRQLETRT